MRLGLFLAAFPVLCAAMPIAAAKFAVLDFWGAGGFVHDSRAAANAFLDSLALAHDFTLVKSQDPKAFDKANLDRFQVVILNQASELGAILDADQEAAAMEFFRTRGAVAWHGTSIIRNEWPAFLAFLGGAFQAHGAGTQVATLRRDPGADAHPLTQGLPASATMDEEWYSFTRNPRGTEGVKVLYTLDEATCKGCGPSMGDHPIVWTVESPRGGRFFHAGMGHKNEVFRSYAFTRTLYAEAILWAAGAGPATSVSGRAWRPGADAGARAGRWFADGTPAPEGAGARGRIPGWR